MEENINIKSISVKNRPSNGWSMLATAILKSAVKEGDVDFLNSGWGEDIFEIANINKNISLCNLKEICEKIHNKIVEEMEELDIFNL